MHEVAALTRGPGPVKRYMYLLSTRRGSDPFATTNLSPSSFMMVSGNRVPQSGHPQAIKFYYIFQNLVLFDFTYMVQFSNVVLTYVKL